jgi:hypothetical protein
MKPSKATGKVVQWLHLVVTGILILAASGCWLVFGLLLYSEAFLPHEGSRSGWDAPLILALLGWLTALTTYVSMYGISKAVADAAIWDKRLVWGRRVVRVTTVLLMALWVCVTVFSPGSAFALGRGVWLLAGTLFLLWLVRRRKTS